MQPTKLATISVNAVGAKNPTPIAQAATVPMRVLVRNVGAALIFIATDSGDVDPKNGPSTGTYRLPPGATDTFVLTPKQNLYALAAGAGGLASVALSEALPFDFRS
jgi:hypothetical protein